MSPIYDGTGRPGTGDDLMAVEGGHLLCGEVQVSGSKNASLPILAASLLSIGKNTLRGVPRIADVYVLLDIMKHMNVHSRWENDDLLIDTAYICPRPVPIDLAQKMRASILLLGPLLARFGRAQIPLPGGCSIGARPIDQHVMGLRSLGAQVMVESGEIVATARVGTIRGVFNLEMPSVTGTENLMLAASRSEGLTEIRNAAQEPEIEDLAAVLQMMGIEVEGAGTSVISIRGTSRPNPYSHRVMPDRIECGTFLIAGALLGNPLTVVGATKKHQMALISHLRSVGARIFPEKDRIMVQRPLRVKGAVLQTAAYPGISTDLQPQLMALLAYSEGISVITETVFDARFQHVAQLRRMGADIEVNGNQSTITGVPNLRGSMLMGKDLRGCAGLLIAALRADSKSLVGGLDYLDRGYARFEEKMVRIGAHIRRVPAKCEDHVILQS